MHPFLKFKQLCDINIYHNPLVIKSISSFSFCSSTICHVFLNNGPLFVKEQTKATNLFIQLALLSSWQDNKYGSFSGPLNNDNNNALSDCWCATFSYYNHHINCCLPLQLPRVVVVAGAQCSQLCCLLIGLYRWCWWWLADFAPAIMSLTVFHCNWHFYELNNIFFVLLLSLLNNSILS